MKIVLTGDARADHFFAHIAVAEEIIEIVDKENIANAEVHYFSNEPFDPNLLFENSIYYTRVPEAKLPKGFDVFAYIKYIISFFVTLLKLFSVFPDLVFSKGGNSALPVVSAAKFLGIPVIIHESNSVPNDVNLWSSKFARAVAVSYKQEIDFFPAEKIIHTGQPIRKNVQKKKTDGAYDFLSLERDIPVIWVLAGSTNAKELNQAIEEALPILLNDYQIIHQTGSGEYEDMVKLTNALLGDHGYKYRYHPFPKLNDLSMKMAAGAADIVIMRPSSTLFEVANWGLPSIVVPLSETKKEYQIRNAYNYAREGACIVIEENNLSAQLLAFEIKRIIENPEVSARLSDGAQRFTISNAAEKIAEEITGVALDHES